MSIKSRLNKAERQLRDSGECEECRPRQIEFCEVDADDVESDEPSKPMDFSPRPCPGCGRMVVPQITKIIVVRPRPTLVRAGD